MSEADRLFEKLGYEKIEDKYNIDFNKRYSFTYRKLITGTRLYFQSSSLTAKIAFLLS